MRATRNNAHFTPAVLFPMVAGIVLPNLLMGTLLLFLKGTFLPLLLCIGSFAVACVLATRVMGLLHSRRVAQSLERDGRRDLDHSYLYGTRMKVGESS
jgi:hypothetical protein